MANINRISRQGKILLKLYNEYLAGKQKYINYPKITEYLFNKPVIRKIKWQYDDNVKPVYLDADTVPFLDIALNNLLDILLSYSVEYTKYLDMVKEYTTGTKTGLQIPDIKYLPVYNDLSQAEKKIIKILESLKNKYQMDYIYKWNFIVNGIRKNNRQKYPINYSNDFQYDFFGQIIYDARLILFAIEYCDDTTEQDIMKQHVLFQMNVHLLRLNRKNSISTEIKNFLKRITNTQEYIILHKIQYELETDALASFITEYKHNHIAYLKNPKPEDLPRIEHIDENDLDDEPEEDIVPVSLDTVNKIASKKMYISNTNNNSIVDKMLKNGKPQDNDILNMAIELVKKN